MPEPDHVHSDECIEFVVTPESAAFMAERGQDVPESIHGKPINVREYDPTEVALLICQRVTLASTMVAPPEVHVELCSFCRHPVFVAPASPPARRCCNQCVANLVEGIHAP